MEERLMPGDGVPLNLHSESILSKGGRLSTRRRAFFLWSLIHEAVPCT
jgi:hypothetical protein